MQEREMPMAEEKSSKHVPKSESDKSAPPAAKATTDKQIDDLLSRARQTIKPIVAGEAESEIVSDDLLNFRMKDSIRLE